MAPGGGSKRKRPERQSSRDEGAGRPSPYRPQDTGLAQENQHGNSRGGDAGGRRQSRQSAQSPAVSSPTPAPQLPRAASQSIDQVVNGSRAATPSQATSATPQPPANQGPKKPPAPYWYEHVTAPVVEAWAESGKDSLLQLSAEADEIRASTLVQELVRAGLDEKLSAFEAGVLIREMIAQHAATHTIDVQSLFLNTLSLLDESDHKSPHLLTLVAATDIDPEVVRLDLDIPLLQALSLVRSTFTVMRTRKTTNLLYRQANFNLLREESEGYAKLITEYFNTANEATRDHSVSAERAFERITALVGSFDLDVGRVLDITLDISANLLVRAYGFFIKFYRCSSWWPDSAVFDNVKWRDQGFSSFPSWALPSFNDAALSDDERATFKAKEDIGLAAKKDARDLLFWDRVKDVGIDAFFELGMRSITNLEDVLPFLNTEVSPEYDARGKEINADRRKRINENRKFMAETGTLPPPGNSDAAQLLGFKLRFYASSARNAQDTLPENLVFLAALLIKIGFISLRDLYPHLHPADEGMADEKKRLEKEKAEKEARERPGAAANALAMAGALTDDTLPTAAARALRSEKEKSGGNTPRPDKKEDEAKEELPPPANQKIQLLKALLLIGAIPEALYILGRFPWLVDVDHTLPPYLHRIANRMLSKVSEMAKPLNAFQDTQAAKDELASLVSAADGTLLAQPRPDRKLTRWLGLDTVESSDGMTYRHYYPDWDDNIPRCQTVEDVVLLCNTFLGYLGVKIGQDAKLLTTLVRIAKYSLSGDFSEQNQALWLDLMRRLLVPALSLSKHNAGLTQEVYELLKLFPTTTRYNIYAEWYRGKTSRLPDMRAAFDHNKAEVKDVLRRVTNESGKKQARALAKVSFASPGNVMMMMISQLESYSNMIPSLVECTRYFSHLAYDILTWCLINSLSGQGRDRMQADGMLTSPWLQALSHFVASLFYRYAALNPSPVLQYLASELRAGNSTDLEVFEQLLGEMAGIRSDMEFNDAQVLAMAGGKHLQAQTVQQLADKRHERKPHAQRLIRALSEPGLIGQTLISIAQERQMYPYHESSKFMPLKVLGSNLDKIQLVFAQYLDVLKTNLNPADFEAAVPDVVGLIADFGLDPGLAFTICRVCIAQRMQDFDSAKKAEPVAKKHRASQGQLQTNGDVPMEDNAAAANEVVPNAEPRKDIAESTGVDARSPSQTAIHGSEELPWHPVLQPIIQQLASAAPLLAEKVSIPFFVSFWTLALQDILVHTASYDTEINKLRAQAKELHPDRADLSASAKKERERKRDALTETQERLRGELKSRIMSYQRTRNRISRQEKDNWFSRSMGRDDSEARHIGLLQECFLPRAMLSSLDAHYCFLMLKILHDNGTPGFSLLRFLNHLFKKQQLATLIFQCTSMEAQHFGRFLNETLKLLHHWHAEKATYDREALGEKQKLPGFAKTLDANGDPNLVLEFEEYRRLLFNWHNHLSAALQTCFKSGEFMYIRNGIIILRAIAQVFPTVNFMGNNMVESVEELSKEETRQDLKLAARSLLGPLEKRKPKWMFPQAFRLSDTAKEGGRANTQTPEPGTGTPRLNAAAQEFKPGSNLANGTSPKESGAEDGEIEDEKQNGKVQEPGSLNTAPATAPAAESTNKTGDSTAQDTVSSEPRREPAASASKPSTPAPIPSKPPPPEYIRPEPSRSSSMQSGASRSHALPSKPPNKPLPALPGPERNASRYGGRDDSFGRLSRPNDVRPLSRDHSPGRSRPRTPERDVYHGGHPASSRGPGRDSREPSRNARDASWADLRREQATSNASRPPYDSRDRPSEASDAGSAPLEHPSRAALINPGPPSANAQQPSRPSTGGSQPASTRDDSRHYENPARLALINNDPTRERESRREAELRGASHRQSDSQNEVPRDPQARGEISSDHAPTGPRRPNGRQSRDFGPGIPSESTNGRLNGPQDIPSAPRPPNGPSGRTSRSNQGPVATARSHDLAPASPSASRPMEPPAAGRGSREAADRRQPGHPSDRQPPSNSLPTTPSVEDGPAPHPSRLRQLDMQPPPIQTDLAASNAPTMAPSGPRGANRPLPGTPTGPSPSTSGPPSGPASATERAKRTERRQVSSINATLQGANVPGQNGQGVNFRGAAQSRPSNSTVPSTAAVSSPVPAIASSMDAPPRRSAPPPPDRQDRPPSRADNRPDLFQSRRGPANEVDVAARPRRGEDERLPRTRGSRDPSRERGEDWRARDDRSGPPPRDSRYPERGPRGEEPQSRRGPPSSFSEQPPADWERPGERRGPPRRDGPDDGGRRGRDSGPPPDFRGSRREEERRDGGRGGPPRDFEGPPPPPPGSRKRRHEDGPPPFDESKRRRSGR
ncbi:transcription factor/nuclear export subunit protein 2-domain-containing protein [Neohortaea acidophila]|uniref:THO complex subunit 2 n=1 Tax=Neohortaea acidophila TaxID=245834 RepID=A0A6A6PWM0_9PEZI|nr:transcription factor/nuclear export subunit protein 2-domain-containing protein [Neohortaea acidophila]KAF2484568.1 transcription factor/nuclear export subunit protein 2-domain-containing protein [Neohortaea acidophila]